MATMRIATVCTIVIAASAAPARTEEVVFPGVGSRIRVYSPSLKPMPIVGTLTAIDETHLTLHPVGGREPRVVPRLDVARLERSVQSSRKRKGALLGLGVGFGVGFAGAAILGNCDESGGTDHCVDFFWGSLYGAAVGAVGAGIGALAAPGERWGEVPINLVRVEDSRPKVPSKGAHLRLVPLLGRSKGLAIALAFR